MVRPLTLQSAFNAGEIDQRLWERYELKYWGTGCSYAENVEIVPQAGFRNRDGLRDVGAVDAAAARLFPFKASDGASYDLVLWPGNGAAWNATAQLDTFTLTGLTADMLPKLTAAQKLDTLLLFHRDLKSKRVTVHSPADWQSDDLPYENIPNYDYGADINGDAYTNAVAAVWEIEFVGLDEGDHLDTPQVEVQSVFTITVSGQETISIGYNATMATLAPLVEAAILDLPNIGTGLTVAAGTGLHLVITFAGADNVGDGWGVSGRVINKADAAILAFKTTPGVAPGEPIISADRGWPQCGTFWLQRLLVGGFKALPNAWGFSAQADYFNYDDRLTAATGPAIVPMDADGGESIEAMTANQNLVINTSEAEYWIAERSLSRNSAPSHINSSTNGTRRGVPVVQNEGASIYTHANGGVLSEFRKTDIEGNFVSTQLSLLAPHLVNGVSDLATKRATTSTNGNKLAIVLEDGAARLVTVLREQEITAFSRLTSTGGTFVATAVNGRNEISFISARSSGRRLERMEEGLLLDEAVDLSMAATSTLTGLARFNGREVWVVAQGDVLGPYTVSGGTIELPNQYTSATVGTFTPLVVKTLPPSREVAPGQVLSRRGRIFRVELSVIDTTSLAIGANGNAARDVDLLKYGLSADVPELEQGYTGKVIVDGLEGFVDDPVATITQLRPGRLTVRSIKIGAVI